MRHPAELMAALFALHDWTPQSPMELRALLATLIKQARKGTEVQVQLIQRDGTNRIYRQESALVEAKQKSERHCLPSVPMPTRWMSIPTTLAS